MSPTPCCSTARLIRAGGHAGADDAAGALERHLRRHARASWGIAGAALGSSLVIATVALGLGSLLAARSGCSTRCAGRRGYLVWLGIKLWRSPPPRSVRRWPRAADALRGRLALLRSLAVALSNPKTLLFFAAFLPQFVDTARRRSAIPGARRDLRGHRWLRDAGLRHRRHAGRALALATQPARVNRGCAAGMWLLAATLAIWRRPGA